MNVIKTIIEKGLSVRQAEALSKSTPKTLSHNKPAKTKDPDMLKLDERLTTHFGTKARVSKKGDKGKLEIEFYSLDELDRLNEVIGL